MALPESPLQKRAKFQVIDGGLSVPTKKASVVIKKDSSPTNIYDGSLKLLAKDLELFLAKHS
ncbi:MAG: hypothetical protein LBR35_00815 [Rickettsiales bacterium]|jgi:hypothetical protein|nr:hypothetical protein [Rickettsiales bacterium]